MTERICSETDDVSTVNDISPRTMNSRLKHGFTRSLPRGRGRGLVLNQNHEAPDNFLNSSEDQHVEEKTDFPVRGRRPFSRGSKGGGFVPKESREDANRNLFEDRMNEKLTSMSGSTTELTQKDKAEKKFNSRCRLYVGNLNDVTEMDVIDKFKDYGETNECFVNPEKQFAFIRLDYRANAERAKRELDGELWNNRPIKIRFAPLGAAIKVRNLTPWVTNELLQYAFSIFGEIEYCQVLVDERGHSIKEGIIEYARKPMALFALKQCSERCFFLTNSLKPIIVEPYEFVDDIDGFPEKSVMKKSRDYYEERKVGPRFANPNSFECEYASRWKTLFEMFKQKEESLKREFKLEEDKLNAQMEFARYEHETEMLREKLRVAELEHKRAKQECEVIKRQADDLLQCEKEAMRLQADEMNVRLLHQDEDLRRRKKENELFVQSQKKQDFKIKEEPDDDYKDGDTPKVGNSNEIH